MVIYDENHISIEDDTDIAFTEDVLKRYEAYGWHVQRVDWTKTGEYKEDVQELYSALLAAKAETSKPSIVSLRTIIASRRVAAFRPPRAEARALRSREPVTGTTAATRVPSTLAMSVLKTCAGGTSRAAAASSP